jgi:hypothetical protein
LAAARDEAPTPVLLEIGSAHARGLVVVIRFCRPWK